MNNSKQFLSFLFFQIIAIICSNETYENANWISIQSGQTQNGKCLANYTGSPIRQCFQNGSNGVWSDISSNPCNCK